MNILFLSLLDFESIDERNIYTDLLREFWKKGHKLYIISPVEKRTGKKTEILNTEKAIIIKPSIFNMQKTGYFEKAISMFLIEPILTYAIKKYISNVKIDLVLYATPPISFYKPVSYVKRRDSAKSYLLQKDIVPEGWIDLEALKTTGVKGKIYKYYRNKEKKLLRASDYIGCMSQANIEYIREHNPFLTPSKIELCPNSIEVEDKSVDGVTRDEIRGKYGIPSDKRVFVYGGNLGKPQGIPFLIDCLRKCHEIEDVFFLIVGDGTEYDKLRNYVDNEKPRNVCLMKRLSKEDYDLLVGACDIGMIFLDHRFTIPNFPSRLLGYMQAKLPVLAVTDTHTDIGRVITEGDFGWWCESNDVDGFKKMVNHILFLDLKPYKESSFMRLEELYDVRITYKTIVKHFGD